MARTDYGAILSTVIKDTSDAVREVNGTSSLIAPNQWGTAIRTMHSDSDYENALEQMIEETATGDIASFSDGANDIPLKNLACTINPVQDLHGQDYPYPSGGGKNKIDADTVYSLYKQSDGSFVGTGNAINSIVTNIPSELVGTAVTFSAYIKIPSDSGITNPRVKATVNGTAVQGNNVNSSTYTLSSVTFTPVSTSDTICITYGGGGSGNVQFKDVQLEKGSTATPYAPYSNICPITGHTELNLVHTGKNLFDKSQLILGKFYNFINGVIIEQNNANKAHSPLLKVKPSATYYMSGFAGNSYYSILALDSEKKPINYYGGASKTEPFIATLPNNCEFVYLNINAELVDTTMFCESDAIIPYEPYTGTTTTTDLGTTVYGGTLDVVSGVTTLSDKQQVRVLNGSENFVIQSSSTNNVVFMLANAMIVPNENDQICSHFKFDANAFRGDDTKANTFVQGGSGRLFIQVPRTLADSTTAFANWLTTQYNNGTPVAYIANKTPTTTQLTPQEVKSLLGSNNFYHDCNGQVAVTYRANGQLYVEQH